MDYCTCAEVADTLVPKMSNNTIPNIANTFSDVCPTAASMLNSSDLYLFVLVNALAMFICKLLIIAALAMRNNYACKCLYVGIRIQPDLAVKNLIRVWRQIFCSLCFMTFNVAIWASGWKISMHWTRCGFNKPKPPLGTSICVSGNSLDEDLAICFTWWKA